VGEVTLWEGGAGGRGGAQQPGTVSSGTVSGVGGVVASTPECRRMPPSTQWASISPKSLSISDCARTQPSV